MTRFYRSLAVFALTFALLAPMAFAANSCDRCSRLKVKPLSIKDVSIYTKSGLLAGKLKVCNANYEDTRFGFQAENLETDGLYSRNFLIRENECRTYSLHFTKDFSVMSKIGDEVQVRIKKIKGRASKVSFKRPDDEFTTIIEGTVGTKEGCANSSGGDGTYIGCTGDFIEHDSGLRIKVLETNRKWAEVMLNGLRWGGNKKVRFYKGYGKYFYVGNDPYTFVKLTSVNDKENRNLLTLEIKSYK